MCRRVPALLAFLLLPLAAPQQPPPGASSSNAEQLRRFYADEWEYVLSHHPELATYVGDRRFNNRLSDYSPAGPASDHAHSLSQLAKLQAIPTTGLTAGELTTRNMMLAQLELSLESDRLEEWKMPVSQMDGPHLSLASLGSQMPFDSLNDYENYLARLHLIPKALDDTTAVMRLGMQSHLMQPRYLLETVATEASNIANNKSDTGAFVTPLAHLPASITPADADRIRTAIKAAVNTEVLPAYARFAAFVRDTYAPAGRTDPGIWALPDGAARYRLNIQQHVKTKQSPDEIFAIGMHQVESIEKQMLVIAKQQGFSDLHTFNDHLRTDKTHFATSAQQLLDLYSGYTAKMQARLPELVPQVPPLKLDVVPMEDFRSPSAVPADYSPGSTAGGRPGRINVNLYQPPQRSLLNIEAIAYHEGVPGHHLQFSFADQLHDLPAFRRYGGYDSYSEGWALYAEQLGKELGFYQDPYSEYGRLQNEMWRSVRLVVDTGVHAKHWTRQQMIDFFHAHTAMDDQNVTTEVDRYISWPGQALAYRLGQMKILELRARAQQRLGAAYDIKQFHAQVLSMGPVPLDILESGIDSWINAQAHP